MSLCPHHRPPLVAIPIFMGLVLPVLGQGSTPPPPPANDGCDAPISITGFGTWTWDNSDATTSGFEGGNPALCSPGFGGGSPTEDVFFVWTAHTADEIRFHCCGSWAGTAMSLHAGNDCNAACIDAGFGGLCESQLDAEIVYVTTAGSNYLIQIGQWGVALSPPPHNLTVELNSPPPLNDDCSTALPVSGPGVWPLGRSLATSSGFDGGDPMACGPAEGTRPPGMDVFVRWIALTSGRKRFSTCGSGRNHAMSVYDGGDCSATCLFSLEDGACTEDGPVEVTLDVVAGDVLLFQIGSQNQFVVPSAQEFFRVEHLNPPGNDFCYNPVPLAVPGTYTYGTQSAGTSGFDGGDPDMCHSPANIPSVRGQIHRDVFYTFTTPCAGDLVITVNDTDLGPDLRRMSLHLGDDCSATCVGSAPGFADVDEFSFVLTDTQAGQPYLLQIGAWSETEQLGTGTLTLGSMDCPIIGTIDSACTPPQPHHLGTPVLLTGSFPEAGPWPLRLEADGGPPGAFGFFLVGPTEPAPITMTPLYQGVLCLKIPIGRYHPTTANQYGDPSLNSVGRFDLDGRFENLSGTGEDGIGFRVPVELPFHPGTLVIEPGDRWSFQLWYRDFAPSGEPGGNLSDLIQVLFP